MTWACAASSSRRAARLSCSNEAWATSARMDNDSGRSAGPGDDGGGVAALDDSLVNPEKAAEPVETELS